MIKTAINLKIKRYINKPTDPGTLSSRHPLHQDLWYFPLTNQDRVVACWTALQPITRQNGGLCIIPGSHRDKDTGKILRHDYPKWNGPSNHLYVSIPHDIYIKVRRKKTSIFLSFGRSKAMPTAPSLDQSARKSGGTVARPALHVP